MNCKIYLMVIKWILLIIQVSECAIDTCPITEITTPTRVAKMCQTTTAVDDNEDRNDNLDGVFLSLTEQENNCSCTVSVKTNAHIFSLFIKQHNNLTEQSMCGIEMDVYFIRNLERFKHPPIKCNSTEYTQVFSLVRNEYIQFKSRVVDGNFLFGYCIQIGSVPSQGHVNGSVLEISCDGREVTTPLDTLTQSRTSLHNITTQVHTASSTAITDKPPNYDKADSHGDSTLYIALGTAGGLLISVSLLIGILLYKRQLSIKADGPVDDRNMQYDSLSESRNTLNYSTLNRTSEDKDEQQYEIVKVIRNE